MDRNLVQAKQSRSCAGELERIAMTAAKTTTRLGVGLVRPHCESRRFGHVRRRHWRALGRRGVAGRRAVLLPLVRIRERRSAADIARSRGLAMSPADRASATDDINRSLNT